MFLFVDFITDGDMNFCQVNSLASLILPEFKLRQVVNANFLLICCYVVFVK